MGALTGSAAGVKARGCARPLRGVLILTGGECSSRSADVMVSPGRLRPSSGSAQ